MRGDDSIRLSPKHGVNPSILKCFACGDDAGVALHGEMGWGKYDLPAPRFTMHPGFFCERCENVVKSGGVLLVETRDGEEGNNPFRTGRMWGVTGEAFDRLFPLRPGPRPPFAYLHESLARKIGFPHDDEPPKGEEVKSP